jgi:hypothetical protein
MFSKRGMATTTEQEGVLILPEFINGLFIFQLRAEFCYFKYFQKYIQADILIRKQMEDECADQQWLLGSEVKLC